MAEPSFANAGRHPGLELWRIESMKPVRIEKVDGKFHQGDSYILLSTVAKGGAFAWNIHFWLGSETSQDEAGVAAYKSVELDDMLGGGPVQHREVQGSESPLFLSYFKGGSGIEYLPGGVDSGFKHVERDHWETRLLHLKGRRTVRVSEVPVSKRSLNRGDVFILDAGLKIYVFNGPTANKYEKTKGIEVVQHINSDSRGGRAHITFLDDDIHNEGFWGPLGGFCDPETLPEGEDDGAVVVPKVEPRLFRISDESGRAEFTSVPLENGKLVKNLLDSKDVFLVHSASNKLYIWVGKEATFHEKKEATAHALAYMRQHHMANTTSLERVSEGVESSGFKSEFARWDVAVPVQARHVAAAVSDPTINVQDLLNKREQMDQPVDDGSGKLQVWVVHDFKLEPVEPSKYGQFYGGDSYVLRYTYVKNRREEDIIYYWLGNKSSVDEIGSAALLAKEMDDSLGGRPVQVRVVQGKEPAHFRQLFKGRMVIHAGGKASGFRNTQEQDSYDTDGVALFHVRGTTPLNTHAVQVAERASSLNSGDCFVLITPTHAYAWDGSGSTDSERAVAWNVASSLANDYNGSGGRVVEQVVEGSEPEEFFDALGGRDDFAHTPLGAAAPKDPRLFHCSDAFGPFTIEEIVDYTQDDLLDEDVYLLDLFTAVYVWVGSHANANERTKATEFANRFVSEAQDGRDPDIPVVVISAGQEPGMFTCNFTGWVDRPADAPYVDPYESRMAKHREEAAAKAAASVAAPSPQARLAPTPKSSPAKSSFFPPPAPSAEPVAAASPVATAATHFAAPVAGSHTYEDLKNGIPAGVDPTKKEEYLSAASFQSVLGVDKAAWSALPKWKRDAKKKEVGLF